MLIYPPLEARHRDRPPLLHPDRPDDWRAVQLWAREATPRDAIFVVPPRATGFRVESLRSVWVDWKDGTVGMFDSRYTAEWVRRMSILGINFGDPSFWAESPQPRLAVLRAHLVEAVRNGRHVFAACKLGACGAQEETDWVFRYCNGTYEVFQLTR